jgi:glutathione S-transferase
MLRGGDQGAGMLTLYDFPGSGNGYKVRLLLARLGLPYRLEARDILRGETRTTDFLAINPNGKIPVLVLEDGTALSESDAILVYLAEGTGFWPEKRLDRARCLQWMFFEQYSHEPAIAVARFILHFMPEDSPRRGELPALERRGYAALDVMEQHLREQDWLIGNRCTVADIALYGYTHCADEGGFDLGRYPGIRAWLERVAAEPGHVGMDDAS